MSVVDTFEDVFDEEADIDIVNRREWGKISNDLKRGGYRDGLTAGQERTVQRGFDTGYSRAVNIGQSLGHLRGRLSAYLSWNSLKNSNSESADKDNHADIETLLKDISKFEQDLIIMVTHAEAVAERKLTNTVGHDGDTTEQCLGTGDTTECCGDSGDRTCSHRETVPAAPSSSTSVSPSDKVFTETFVNVIIEAQAKCDQFAVDVQNLLDLKCDKHNVNKER